ncbi:MAG: hypothetical protein PHV02_12050 [Rhodocyclaceae bacterium]|nr:hypothetical protein [Rhodocyclaceae bacterium]
MKNTNTLTLKKPGNPSQANHKQRPERALVGQDVILQTKSPSRIVGKLISFDGGWIVIAGTEYRWLSDGSLSAPITSGSFTLDRSVVTYIVEVM